MRILFLVFFLFALLSVCVSEKTRNHGGQERRLQRTMPYSSAIEDTKFRRDGTVRDDFPCPEAAAIAPCECSEDYNGNGLVLDCTAAEYNDQLTEVFLQEFPVTEFYLFQIAHTYNLFNLNFSTNGVSFEEFAFCCGSMSIESISEDVFRDSADRVVRIEISNSEVTSNGFPFEMISEFPVLEEFSIYVSKLTEMPVIESESMIELDLEENQISALNPGK